MKVFELIRKHDVTGVSGSGKVLQGIVFDSGVCVVHWLKPVPGESVSVFKTFNVFKKIHVDSHPENESQIDFIFDDESRRKIGGFDFEWLMKVIKLKRGDKVAIKFDGNTSLTGTVVKMDWDDGLHEIVVNGQLTCVKTEDILVQVDHALP